MKTMRTVSKPTKVYAVLFISLMLVMAISPALGKKRSDYLLDYAKSNELANGGFKNSQVGCRYGIGNRNICQYLFDSKVW